ncbi:hypothetical protein SDC9_202466 [bioreactor metagenome]|uniref:Phage tail protein n=1 Tax=bioreactor metagenome TaxID=1076179 RepID=A0A645IWJ0_9ZZZZ
MTEYSSISTKLYLDQGNGGSPLWKELYGLYEVPEMGSSPEKIEVTNLSDSNKRYVFGVQDFGDMEFKFYYNAGDTDTTSLIKNSYTVLRAAETAGTVKSFKVAYPDGSGHAFSGYVSVRRDSVAVNGAISFTLVIAVASEISDVSV